MRFGLLCKRFNIDLRGQMPPVQLNTAILDGIDGRNVGGMELVKIAASM